MPWRGNGVAIRKVMGEVAEHKGGPFPDLPFAQERGKQVGSWCDSTSRHGDAPIQISLIPIECGAMEFMSTSGLCKRVL